MNKSIKDMSASVRGRLLDQARATNRPFRELLQYFAMERFLYRLSESPHGTSFTLKGALLLSTWGLTVSRSTKDIDLLGHGSNDTDTLVDIVREICVQRVEPDGLRFDPSTVEGESIVEDADYHGVRIRFWGLLGKARIRMQVDIGFGDTIVPSALLRKYPTILDAFGAPKLQTYSRESTIAEKFEAMTKLGLVNSRMKDFYDIWLLSRHFEFEAATLSKAIRVTFENRQTRLTTEPSAWTRAFYGDRDREKQWKAFLRRTDREATSTPDLKTVVDSIREFLKPVAASLSDTRNFTGRWQPGGPWE